MDDITPALLEALRKRFEENLGGSRRAAALMKAIQDAGAGYAEAEQYAEEVGRALSGAFGAVLTADVLPDGRMYWNIADRVVRPLLEQDHRLVADAAVQVQTALNRAAGLGIRAQRAPLDTDRINGLLNKLCAAQDYDSVRWVLGEPVINYSMAVADETLRLNVAWQAGAGLSPRITRRAEAGACRWCRALAGVWDFDDAPEDIYRRHENCRCVVEYDPGDGRRQNAHTKRWTNAQQRDKIEERKQTGSFAKKKRTVVSQALADGTVKDSLNRELEEKHLRPETGRSYLYGSMEDAETLYNELKGTGEPVFDKNGNWNHKERVIGKNPVGVYVGQDGTSTETSAAMIVYSKTGSHLYPRREEIK